MVKIVVRKAVAINRKGRIRYHVNLPVEYSNSINLQAEPYLRVIMDGKRLIILPISTEVGHAPG